MNKQFLLLTTPFLGIVLTLVIYTKVFAQSPSAANTATPSVSVPSGTPTPTLVISDFAKDLEKGKQEAINDEEAQKNQKDQKDSENVGVNEQGEVMNGQLGVNQEDLVESDGDLNSEGKNEDNKSSMREKRKNEEGMSDDKQSTKSSSSQQENNR